MAISQWTREGKHYYKHVYGKDNTWLAEATQYVDANKQLNVFYALSGYDPNGAKTDSGVLKRAHENVQWVRSFWLDLDVGEPEPNRPPKYATQRDAATALMAFAATVGLPKPFIVKSGGGLHAYWPMQEDMGFDVWKQTAELLKAACRAEGLLADPSRTADAASVLRPPGTHHRKAEPKPVKVILEGDVSSLNNFQAALMPYVMHLDMGEPADDILGPMPDHLKQLGPTEDLEQGIEQRRSKSAKIAEQCGVMRLMRDTKGNLDQPTWYYSLGVMAFTDDGASLAHDWSSGHPAYDPGETDSKLAQAAKVGHPTTCRKLGDHQPAICAACPFNGKIKTPWSLGVYDPDAVPVTVEQVVKGPQGFHTVKVADLPFPENFLVTEKNHKRVLSQRVHDEETDQWVWDAFCDTPFWPVSRLWIEGVAHIECEMELPRYNERRRFMIEGGVVGKGKDSLAAALARNEIVPLNGKAHVMDTYMKRWMTHLTETADMQLAYRHFGWTGDDHAFVLGDTVLHSGGGQTRPLLVGMAKSKGPALALKGDLQTWVDIVDRAYNAPGQEAFQFIVACGFAAPLLSMLQQVSGVTVYAHSEGSGVGKTTAQRAALSAWGNWDQLMLADGKTTHNALWGLMGAYHSLPVVYDELTNQRNDVASDLVFSISSGRSKERMNAEGGLRENNSNWCTILLASGNTLLSEKLALHRGNAEAEMSRLFEFTLRATPHLSPNEANSLFPKLLDNHGHAGRVFASYVVENYDEVTMMLQTAQKRLNERFGITQVERHWSALLAAVTTSVAICRTLGLLQFDAAALRTWMFERLAENRVQRDAATNNPLELLGTMLADLWSGILVTNGEGDVRRNRPATIVQQPRGTLVGRAILSDGSNSQPVLMLNQQAVRDWCNKKGVSAREMFDAAVQARWADANLERYSLGRGTVEYANVSSYISCWKLNPERITGSDAGKLVSQRLGTVDGGKDAIGGRGQ